MPSIEVVLGLILIILFYSLLATIVMELLSNYLGFRGKHLEKVLRNMLSSKEEEGGTFSEFLKSPLYQQLAGKFYGKKGPPSYLSSKSFRSILMKILGGKGVESGVGLKSRIDELPDEQLQQVLTQLLEDANYQVNTFKENVEGRYDDIMDRASGWYTRYAQKLLLLIGLGIAIVFNADTLAIYASLASSSKADLDKLVALAENVSSGENVTEASSNINREVYEMIETNLEDLKDPLSIGWGGVNLAEFTWRTWILKIFGWLVTALCISKGAPFWFDLLKKAVNMRGTGNVPQAAGQAGSEGGVAKGRQVSIPETKGENIVG